MCPLSQSNPGVSQVPCAPQPKLVCDSRCVSSPVSQASPKPVIPGYPVYPKSCDPSPKVAEVKGKQEEYEGRDDLPFVPLDARSDGSLNGVKNAHATLLLTHVHLGVVRWKVPRQSWHCLWGKQTDQRYYTPSPPQRQCEGETHSSDDE